MYASYQSSNRSTSTTPSARNASAAPLQPNSIMRWLWTTLAGCFGPLWTSTYGTSPESEAGRLWAKALGECTQKQLQRGVDAATSNDKTFPPTLPQFRAWCLAGDKAGEVEESTEDRHARLLARDRSDLEYFQRANTDWAKAHGGEELFDISACFNSAQRADLGLPPSDRPRPDPRQVMQAIAVTVGRMA